MIKKAFLVTLLFFAVLVMTGCGGQEVIQDNGDGVAGDEYTAPQVKADKIEVVHFHGTHQCSSCISVGEYALKTIKEKFPKEYKNKTIVFKDINGELAENRQIVEKYQARGSSLFINAISEGKDHIEEDVTVWHLVSNEDQFVDYFGDKLNSLF